MTMQKLLLEAVEQRVLRRLDVQFAMMVAGNDEPAVMLAAALLSRDAGEGHVCLPLSQLRAEAKTPALLQACFALHDDSLDWPQTLLRSPAVSSGELPTPLVLIGDRLYLNRMWRYERAVAGFFSEANQPLVHDSREMQRTLNALFASDEAVNWQKVAAAVALTRRISVISGGPGTGKTTTVARLLAALIQMAGEGRCRIRLAAPTGKAAARLTQSLGGALQTLPLTDGQRKLFPAEASTLHRLLGAQPGSQRLRYHAGNPLHLDVLVVDEASMVDLPLMSKLVDAVADGTQLILLGDADQLPSVEAGDVLAGILAAAGPGHTLRADDADALRPLLGDATPTDTDTTGLRGHRVQLLRGYRQDADFDLAPLANAARDGDADTALSLLRGGTMRGVDFHEGVLDPFEVRREALLAHWRSLADAPDPASALSLAQRLRLLTAVREGPQGARGLNARIEELLSGRRTGPTPPYFHGRLLLINENSYRHRLFNGDIGICLRDEHGALTAWFPGDAPGEVRAFHPAALPAHESAFAMTVHKAQGSEFDEVWLQLPRNDSRVLSRELIYTAITRARTRLHVAGSAQVLRDALARHAVRMSGLAWRLRE